MLGLTETSQITVGEGCTLEVCVVIEAPELPCPVKFSFEVIIEADGMHIVRVCGTSSHKIPNFLALSTKVISHCFSRCE